MQKQNIQDVLQTNAQLDVLCATDLGEELLVITPTMAEISKSYVIDSRTGQFNINYVLCATVHEEGITKYAKMMYLSISSAII